MPCRPASRCFSKARPRSSTASRQAATMRRPSSARISSACSATAPTNISRTPTFGVRASILTIFRRWKPNRSKCSRRIALQASEQRLTDAIESISEGFSLYDAQDRLVLGNYKYKELFDHGEGPPKPGMTYEEILRTVVESELIQDARSRPEAWIEERLAQHRNPGEPVLEHRANGSWIQVSERRTENAGRVAVYSDLTELKESEQRAAAANLLILQSLRYARRIQAAILPQLRETSTCKSATKRMRSLSSKAFCRASRPDRTTRRGCRLVRPRLLATPDAIRAANSPAL